MVKAKKTKCNYYMYVYPKDLKALNEFFVELVNRPMPILWELTTVLQYMVAIEESMAFPPSSITFLALSQGFIQNYHSSLSNLSAWYGVHRHSGILVNTKPGGRRPGVNLVEYFKPNH